MNTTDYIFDPDNPWICQEFIQYRKDFMQNTKLIVTNKNRMCIILLVILAMKA